MIKNKKKFNGIKFIEVTHKILQQNEYTDIIKWDEQGTNIIIIDKQLLQQIVLPKYFKHAKYSSFLRQLNLYGFTSSKDQNGCLNYHHQHFMRNNYDKNSIQKKLQIKDIQKSLGIFQQVQAELQGQLLSLQMDQNRIKQSLLNSIDQQLSIRCNIKEFLETIRFFRLQGEDQFEQFIQGIQTIFSGLNTTALHHFQHLINIVFKQFNTEENQYSQYQSEIDEYSNSYMISPYPFGLLELKENLKAHNDQYFKTQDSSLDY